VLEGGDDAAGGVVPAVRVDLGIRTNWGLDAIRADLPCYMSAIT